MAANGAASGAGLLREVTEFLYREAELLDDRRFEEWIELYTEDSYYWAPTSPDQTSRQGTLSLIHDDKEKMRLRVARLRHPAIHAQSPPSRSCHVIGNVLLVGEDAGNAGENAGENNGEITVRSNFVMTEHRTAQRRLPTRLYSGRCEHRLRRDGDGWRIAAKKVVLTDCDDFLEMISLPI